MTPHPYWINSQLAIIPRPTGDNWVFAEMLALRQAGIDIVVSMLEDVEAAVLGLEREREAAQYAGMSFVSFPIPDHSVPPNLEAFLEFLSQLELQLRAGKRVGVHCRASIGRSGVVTASLLIRAGVPLEQAWAEVTTARQYPVPDTAEQALWVKLNIKKAHS